MVHEQSSAALFLHRRPMNYYSDLLVDPRPSAPPEDNWPETESDCIIDGSWGIYVAQRFCERYHKVDGVSQEDWDICLAGPDHTDYWEAWDTILGDWQHEETDEQGRIWKIYLSQDGDLFQYRECIGKEK